VIPVYRQIAQTPGVRLLVKDSLVHTLASLKFRSKAQIQRLIIKWERMRVSLMPPSAGELRILTGADFTHFKGLMQLVRSIERHEGLEGLTVYDLGLEQGQCEVMTSTYPALKVIKFNFSEYPSFFNIRCDAGQYAWKPIIIESEFNQSETPVLWLDAGCMVDCELKAIRKILAARGFYSPRSSGTISDWTHPEMLLQLKAGRILLSRHNLSGGVVGLNPKMEPVKKLVEKWAECARNKNCIAPEGSNRSNHRQDQAALSVLAWQTGLARHSPTAFYGIRIHCN
jgi:hypothetical protein